MHAGRLLPARRRHALWARRPCGRAGHGLGPGAGHLHDDGPPLEGVGAPDHGELHPQDHREERDRHGMVGADGLWMVVKLLFPRIIPCDDAAIRSCPTP